MNALARFSRHFSGNHKLVISTALACKHFFHGTICLDVLRPAVIFPQKISVKSVYDLRYGSLTQNTSCVRLPSRTFNRMSVVAGWTLIGCRGAKDLTAILIGRCYWSSVHWFRLKRRSLFMQSAYSLPFIGGKVPFILWLTGTYGWELRWVVSNGN